MRPFYTACPQYATKLNDSSRYFKIKGLATHLTPTSNEVEQIFPGLLLTTLPNVYALMDVDCRGVFGSEDSLIERNLTYVNDFATARAKVAVPLEARVHEIGPFGNWAWFFYKFSLAEVCSPESRKKFTDIVLERDEMWAVTFVDNFNKLKTVSLVDKLMKLNDLKNNGVLSEVEFEQQKVKLLTEM